jgi:23S rRNA (cytosine1962-C5)-methyltransferase
LERAIRSGHPWIFRDALEPYEAAPGRVCDVADLRGRFLCRGLSESGPIGVRVFTVREEPLDRDFFRQRFLHAVSARKRVIPEATSAYRLLHGEGDRLPGITCDRYDRYGVLRLDGDAAVVWRDSLVQWLREPLQSCGIEGLLVRESHKHKKAVALAWGAEPPEPLIIEEHGMRLAVSLREGQKTGLFLDHRESRFAIRRLSRELRVLNLYGYTGGFSVSAGLGGATDVTTVDIAEAALALARRSWELNGLDTNKHHTITADVPQYLAELAKRKTRFGLIVADPPSFAPKQAAKPEALSSYIALHQSALELLEPEGYYLAASCSSHVDRQEFDATLRDGARMARSALQILERWEAPADHPRLLAFPEGNYLKITLARVR